jgi:hypothetical protein
MIYNDESYIKLSVHTVKQVQNFFHGRFPLQVVRENPGRKRIGEDEMKAVAVKQSIETLLMLHCLLVQ